jgi:hypothetical protein
MMVKDKMMKCATPLKLPIAANAGTKIIFFKKNRQV